MPPQVATKADAWAAGYRGTDDVDPELARRADRLNGVDMERTLLGTAILKGSGLKAAGIEPRILLAEEHQAITAAFLCLEDQGKRVDIKLLGEHLEHAGCGDDTAYSRIGGAGYLGDLITRYVGLADSLPEYAAAVRERYDRRQLYEMGERLQHAATNGRKPGDVARETIGKLEGMAKAKDDGHQEMRFDQMKKRFTGLRLPTIFGLSRAGEIMNIIAPPKTGKSWLVLFLALCIATGQKFLGKFKTAQGKVLLLDNELHEETLTDRIQKVADAMGLKEADYVDYLGVRCLRGQQMDMEQICAMLLANYKPGDLRAVIIDSMYKAYPPWCDENKNADMTRVYTMLDNCALELGCTIILIHHSSKGSQSEKSVTDTGAGAGAQSRSPDCHLVIREHEQAGAYVVEAVVRSWEPLEPICVEREFPLWKVVEGLDPALLKRPNRRPKKDKTEGKAETDRPVWTVNTFAAAFIAGEPATEGSILAKATADGLTLNMAKQLLKCAKGLPGVHTWAFGSRTPNQYATVPQPALPLEAELNTPELPKKRGRPKRKIKSGVCGVSPPSTPQEIP